MVASVIRYIRLNVWFYTTFQYRKLVFRIRQR